MQRKGKGKNESELWFEAYCHACGLDGWEKHEPNFDLPDGSPRPDYQVGKDSQKVICEVKEFTRGRVEQHYRFNKAVHLPSKDVYGNVRASIRAAKPQLKAVKHLGLPLVVVLANPHGRNVHLGNEDVIRALYGDPKMNISADPDDTDTGYIYSGRNGVLGGDQGQYISAVAVLGRRAHEADFEAGWWEENDAALKVARAANDRQLVHAILDSGIEAMKSAPMGTYHYIDVYHTLGATFKGLAVQLPNGLFSGPHDRNWTPVQQSDGGVSYELTSGQLLKKRPFPSLEFWGDWMGGC
jgi:hypothetical protein